MLILIAESKTMTKCERDIAPEYISLHRPAFDDTANSLMSSWRDIPIEQLSEAVKISLPMAREMKNMIRDFSDKSHGITAIESFTGVVFKALDFNTMTDTDKDFACRHLRIISSLYGWLRPDDVIKPYRLDFTTRLAPDDNTLASFWQNQIAQTIISEIDRTGCTEIVDLMPSDAAKCINMKVLKKKATVWKIAFEKNDGKSVRSPHAMKLKTLRGTLLRQIINERIDDISTLCSLSEHYDPLRHTITFSI